MGAPAARAVARPRSNAEVAASLDEMADLLDIEGANPFRVRAYRRAAITVRQLPRELRTLVTEGADLSELPGIGKDLAEKITALTLSGSVELLEQLEREVDPRLLELLRLPGLGPKRVNALRVLAGVHSLDELRTALRTRRLEHLKGFGPTTLKSLQAAVDRPTAPQRYSLEFADARAQELIAALRSSPGVSQLQVAGSVRRRKEQVGDLDLLACSTRPQLLIKRLVTLPQVRAVNAQGDTRAAVTLDSGLHADLRVVASGSFGAALHYFTGSKGHNIAIRTRGLERGLKINEYGVYRGARAIAGKTEASVYRAVGLPFIAPELRETRGEIEAAEQGRLPRLVELEDLHGDLHAHTDQTDGHASLQQMAEAARALGHAYLAITDHSRHLAMTGGLDARRLLKQGEQIDAWNERNQGLRLLKGLEVDILEDGSLDLPDAVLARLDLVVASVHSGFNLPREKQTARVLKALDNRYVTILGHPTGRLLGEREGYQLDLEQVLRHAKQRGNYLELNASPLRLDLDDLACRTAKDLGVLVSIASDAHAPKELGLLSWGVGQARRGWLEAQDVLNARPLKALLPLLQAPRR